MPKMRHARTSAWPHPDNAIERKGERARKIESLLVKCALLEPRHSPFQQCSRERERERKREREREREEEREKGELLPAVVNQFISFDLTPA